MSAHRLVAIAHRVVRSLAFAVVAALLVGVHGLFGAAEAASTFAFSPKPIFTYQREGVRVSSATDLDGDGKLDLLLVHPEGLALIYGRGDGSFEPAVELPLGSGLGHGVSADLDGDGRRDLAICHNGLGRVLVLRRRGHRDYAPAVNYPVGSEPVRIAVVDLNRDGALDLAVSNHRASALSLMYNLGNGTFQTITGGGGGIPYSGWVVSADFNRDGRPDLAQTYLVSGRISIMLQRESGAFGGPSYGTGGEYPSGIAVGDYNGDTLLDLAVANIWGHSASLFFGDGFGNFGTPIAYTAGSYPHSIAAADFDGDGDLDLVFANGLADRFTILQNHEQGNFLAPTHFPTTGRDAHSLDVGDFNGDGRPDLAIETGSDLVVGLYLNQTPRPEAPTFAIDRVTIEPWQIVAGNPIVGKVILAAPALAGRSGIALKTNDPSITSVPAIVPVPAGATEVLFTMTTRAVTIVTAGFVTAEAFGKSVNTSFQVLPPAPPPPASGNLLVNGSFEEPDSATYGDGVHPLGPGGLPGWRIIHHTVDVIHRRYWQPAPGQGNQSLDLVGTPGASRLEQTIATEPGKLYLLSGWHSHNPEIAEGRAEIAVNDTVFATLHHSNALHGTTTHANMRWQPFAFAFRATAPTTTVRFDDTTRLWDAGGAVLDGLSVVVAEAVGLPEVGPLPVYNPANGHWYQMVFPQGSIGWEPARDAADRMRFAGLRGHLVAIASQEENQFVWSRVVGEASNWNFWIGGYQDRATPDFGEPGGGWRWITGEPFKFTNWLLVGPNNYLDREHVLAYPGGRGGFWDDASGTGERYGYIVEYEAIDGPASALALEIVPSPLSGGQATRGTLRLSAPAPAGGLTVSLFASTSSVTVPASVTIPEGETAVSFPIATSRVSLDAVVAVEGRAPSRAVTAWLHLKPWPSFSLAVEPNPVIGGQGTSGTVTLTAPSEGEGFTLHLLSSNPQFVTVPATVVVTPGETFATFPVSTAATTTAIPVVITGGSTGAGSTVTMVLNLLPPPPAPLLTLISLTLDPERVVGGNAVRGTVVLTGPAPAGGVAVALSATGHGVQVPASVLVPEGKGSAEFTIVTQAVQSATTASIQASFGETRRETLTVLPPPPVAPESTAVITPTPNSFGWNNTDVTVEIRAAGNVKEVQYVVTGPRTIAATVPGNTATVALANEGLHAVTYFARSVTGQTEFPKTITVRIDKTPPTVTYGSHPGTYSIEQTVRIPCRAEDALSGIAAHTCVDIIGLAWRFDRVGLNLFTAAAIDKAGNLGSGATYFTVRTTVEGLNAMSQGLAPNGKMARALSKCLAALKKTKPGSKARARELANYIKRVQKERGRTLPPDQADLLIALARGL